MMIRVLGIDLYDVGCDGVYWVVLDDLVMLVGDV